MVASRALALSVLLMLSGCGAPGGNGDNSLGPGGSFESGSTPPDPRPPGPSTSISRLPPAPAPPPQVAEWGTWSLTAQGGPGDWLVAYQPIPAGTTFSDFTAQVDASATGPLGEPVGLLVFAPQLTALGPNGVRVTDDAHLRFRVNPLGGDVSWPDEYMASGIEGPIPGMFVAVASNGEWSFSMRVTIGDGPAASGTFVHEGEGASFAYAGAPLPLTGTVTLDAQIDETGWTHLMVPVGACPRSGSRSYDIVLPDGTTDNTQDQPIQLYDFVGSFTDPPGPLHASIEYTETGTGTSLALMHMPAGAGAFPPEFDLSGYRRTAGQPTCE